MKILLGTTGYEYTKKKSKVLITKVTKVQYLGRY